MFCLFAVFATLLEENGGVIRNLGVMKKNISHSEGGLYEVFESKSSNLRIVDLNEEEGMILFVITEDHETGETSNCHLDNTPDSWDISAYEAKVDLVDKGYLADRIANKYGIKWTHMIDVGSCILTPKYAKEFSGNESWNETYNEVINYLIWSYKNGNDIQLHMHCNSIPDSPNFGYYYDNATDELIWNKSIKETKYPSTRYNSWANVYTKLGDEKNPYTRVGSLIRGKSILESILKPYNPDYRVVFFRAGQWDFGDNKDDIKKSFIALGMAGFLGDSSLSSGTYYKQGFRFGSPVGKNVFLVKIKDENKTDIVFEILPTVDETAFGYSPYPITPLKDPKLVKNIYESLIDGKERVKPGIHIIMEMYHIGTTNSGTPYWDSSDLNIGDWKKMDYHFKYISKECPKIKFVTISEALDILIEYTCIGET